MPKPIVYHPCSHTYSAKIYRAAKEIKFGVGDRGLSSLQKVMWVIKDIGEYYLYIVA